MGRAGAGVGVVPHANYRGGYGNPGNQDHRKGDHDGLQFGRLFDLRFWAGAGYDGLAGDGYVGMAFGAGAVTPREPGGDDNLLLALRAKELDGWQGTHFVQTG